METHATPPLTDAVSDHSIIILDFYNVEMYSSPVIVTDEVLVRKCVMVATVTVVCVDV